MVSTNWKIGPDRLLWLFISLMLVMSQTGADNCDSKPQISITQPFIAQIEATFSEKSTTILIKEYFQPSQPGDATELGAAIQTQNGEVIHAIFNYTSRELFYIADDVCTIVNSIPSFTNILQDNPNTVKNAFIFSTKDILRITQDSTCIAHSNTTIRGIEAQHFRNTLADTAQFKNYQVDFYFTRDNWKTEDDYTKAVPLRIEFTGVLKQTGKHFSHYFDYFYFNYVDGYLLFEERLNAFETPPGVFCPGRKHQSPLPILPLAYSVTIQFVDPIENSVTISKLWTDNELKMIRRDFHPISYYGARHPVTEIYNYITGTVYTRDNLMLNCSYNSLLNADINDADILQHLLDMINVKTSGMPDTLKILDLEGEIYYNGQRIARNIPCDVFIAIQSIQMETGGSKNVTFEYYFMSDDVKMLPDRGGPNDILSNVPMMLEISFNHDGIKRNYFYNFFDFSNVVSYKDFDTSACYNETKDIVFKITFKGQYLPSLNNAFIEKVHNQIADHSLVHPYRVQNIHVEYDDHFIFVFASIIDPSPPETQFVLHKNKMIKSDKQQFIKLKRYSISLCATECIEYDGCNGFQLTSDGLCTVITMKFSEKNIDSLLTDSQGTSFYARTTMKHMMWASNSNVWNALFRNVNNRVLTFELKEPITNESHVYTSYYIELLKGEVSSIAFPILPNQMYYHEEITLPSFQETAYHEIWYDDLRKLMRLDQYILSRKPPFYTQGILTTIHDYNTGVAYFINKDLRNCTVLPISNTSVDASMQKVANTSVVRLKTPQEFFYINSNFMSIGQSKLEYDFVLRESSTPGNTKTVRGILCDIYETVRYDYIVPGRTTPSESTFRYYVANDEESEVTSDVNKVSGEPILLEIISDSVLYYAMHSFFDFDPAPISLDVFDIKDCYELLNDYMFQVVFQGDSVEPAKENPNEFIQGAQIGIAKIMTVEVLRIQEPVIEYDDKYVYFTAKLISFNPIKGDVIVTEPPIDPLLAIGLLMNQVVGGYLFVNLTITTTATYKAISMREDVRRTDTDLLQMENNLNKFAISKRDSSIVDSKVIETFNMLSIDDCANLCLVLDEKCNGFSFCINQGDCYLTGEYPDTHPNNLNYFKGCLVYNREYINQYDKKPGRSMVLKGDKSVDADNEHDCAKQCTMNKDFICEAFEYCDDLQECTLNKVHTMDIPDDQISFVADCDIFSRKFISEFHVIRNHTVKMVNNEILEDMTLDRCAKACMEMEDYTCNDFDYCNTTKECRLVYKDVQNSGQVSFEKSAVCDHYTRIPGTFYHNHAPPSSNTVYDKADFIRVALILLFCGIILGVVSMYIYIRRKKTIGI